jgi:hypothetical protein
MVIHFHGHSAILSKRLSIKLISRIVCARKASEPSNGRRKPFVFQSISFDKCYIDKIHSEQQQCADHVDGGSARQFPDQDGGS